MASAWRVAVHDLLRSPGHSRRVQLAAPMGELQTPLGRVAEGDDVVVTGRLDAVTGGIWFDGEVSGTYALACSRCLVDLEVDFVHEVGELFSSDIRRGAEEGYPLEGDVLDFEPLVRDSVLLGIPPQHVCDAACAGLCAGCGADLNEGPCGCAPETGHPAFAELRRLFPSDR